MSIFTDGSSNIIATYIINGKKYTEQTTPTTAQVIKLQAVTMVFHRLIK